MLNYSITLNFFIPQKVVDKLNKVVIYGDVLYDWRKSRFCHCTLKAIASTDKIPEKGILDYWVSKSSAVIKAHKPFAVKIHGIESFPTAIFAKVDSPELVSLHKNLYKILPSSQPQFENENYVPHVSVAMKDRDVEIVSGSGIEIEEFTVNEIQLVIWDLQNFDKSIIYDRFKLR